MRLLLDTHVVLWWLADDPSLGSAARAAIADSRAEVFVSAASVWEVAIKRELGKLTAPDDLLVQLDGQRFECLPLTAEDAWAAGHLARHHTDPFDRAIVAQAMRRDLAVVTRDRTIAQYGVSVISP